MRLLNLRVPDALADLIEVAARLSGEGNRSAWCREALEAGAHRELRAAETRASQDSTPPRTSGMTTTRGAGPGGLLQPSGCQHPPPARRKSAEVESCSLCGVVTRWLR